MRVTNFAKQILIAITLTLSPLERESLSLSRVAAHWNTLSVSRGKDVRSIINGHRCYLMHVGKFREKSRSTGSDQPPSNRGDSWPVHVDFKVSDSGWKTQDRTVGPKVTGRPICKTPARSLHKQRTVSNLESRKCNLWHVSRTYRVYLYHDVTSSKPRKLERMIHVFRRNGSFW